MRRIGVLVLRTAAKGRLCPLPASGERESNAAATRSFATGLSIWLVPIPLLRRMDRLPDACRRERHVEMRDAEIVQGVKHGVDHGRRRGDRAGFADALDAERIGLGRNLDELRGEKRK